MFNRLLFTKNDSLTYIHRYIIATFYAKVAITLKILAKYQIRSHFCLTFAEFSVYHLGSNFPRIADSATRQGSSTFLLQWLVGIVVKSKYNILNDLAEKWLVITRGVVR